MHYRVLFDVATSPYRAWLFSMFGLLFVTVGVDVFVNGGKRLDRR